MSILLFSLLLIAPEILGAEMKYFSFFYIFSALIIMLTIGRFRMHVKLSWSFWLLILLNIILLLVYLADANSVLNITTLLLSYLALFYLVSRSIDLQGEIKFQDSLFCILSLILLAIFLLSPILTLLQWHNAPEYYPWEAFYSDARLFVPHGAGHSNVMWLMAFVSAFLIRDISRGKKRSNPVKYFFVVFFSICLIATKSRLALIFIAILLFEWIAYQGLFNKKIFAVICLTLPVLYILSILNPFFNNQVIESVSKMQESIPGVRIQASSHLQGESSIYAGRYILNLALVDEAIEHPWFGVGHSDDLLRYGVDRNGFPAYGGNKLSSSESGLRVWTEYGTIYFLVLLMFITIPIFRAMRGYYRDNIFVIAVCGIIFGSAIGGSVFENLYGMSGLFAIILIYFHLMKPCKMKWKTPHILGLKLPKERVL